MIDTPLLSIALLASVCGACQWLAWKIKLPSIVFLLIAGVAVGPVFSLFNPDALFGNLLFPFISVAVAIILFEGGLTLHIGDIRKHGSVVTRLISIGVLVTWLLLASAVHFIFDLNWSLSMVFGSIAVVSGPTVVKPILRTVLPSEKIRPILQWEGILIDPIGVFLALLVFEYVLAGTQQQALQQIAFILGKLLIVGTVFGVASGYATTIVLRQHLVPDYLQDALMLLTVVVTFTIAESIQHESGLLAVTIMGIWLANARGVDVRRILHFKEDLSILLISTLFVVLAARLELSVFPEIAFGVLLLLATAQFLIRPFNVWLCTLGSNLSKNERLFIAWIAPRGIVAAAISSLFALRLQEASVPQAELLVPLTFSMIIGTVVLQSLSAKPKADRLGVSNPAPNGVLILGANSIGLALADIFRSQSVKVLLADTSGQNIKDAQQDGFTTYHGNPTSGHAEENLDRSGLGQLIAVSADRDTNALAAVHFREEFGSESVFLLGGESESDISERFDAADRHRGNPLFDQSLTRSSLRDKLIHGAIETVKIPDGKSSSTADTDSENETLSPDQASTANNKTSEDTRPWLLDPDELCLFAIDTEGKVHIYGSPELFEPAEGWRIIVLLDKSTRANDSKE